MYSFLRGYTGCIQSIYKRSKVLLVLNYETISSTPSDLPGFMRQFSRYSSSVARPAGKHLHQRFAFDR